MKPYNGFTGKQREQGDKLIKQAIADGIKPPPTKCSVCGQMRGILHYHCEDYSPENVVDDAKCMCWLCHMLLHCYHRNPEAVTTYFSQVLAGKKFPPTWYHNFYELKKYGIE